MTTIRIAPRAWSDLDCITDHLLAHGVPDVEPRMAETLDALQVPDLHPFIGWPRGSGQREPVIGRGARGYAALYGCDHAREEVFVNALRAQREAGYRDA